jgi:integrase
VAGVRKRPNKRGGNYQGWFINHTGERKFFLGTSSRTDTLEMAKQLEAEHRKMRNGLAPLPTSALRHRSRRFSEIVDEYLSWGRASGRKDGSPWTAGHAARKADYLRKWTQTLGLETMADLDGILPKVEAALREMAQQGKAGNTLRHRAMALVSLCRWCVEREYLMENPLRRLRPIGGPARTQRRALTLDEITRLLAITPEYRRLLYATALLSGLRVSELRALTRQHLDEANAGLILDAKWTKNRQPGFQPLPGKLVKQLAAFADSGVVDAIYRRLAVRFTWPRDALLVVGSHASRWLDADLERAGIDKVTKEGRLDFHGLRSSYVTLAIEGGANVKEAQVLARHSTPELTMNKYARKRDARLGELVESIGDKVLSAELCAAGVHQGSIVPEQAERKCLPEHGLLQNESNRGLCRVDTGPGSYLCETKARTGN